MRCQQWFQKLAREGSPGRGNVFRSSGSDDPAAAVAAFRAEATEPVAGGTDFDGLCKRVDGMAPNRNGFCAVKVVGRFRTMKTRSVPAQKKPYPPLAEVTMPIDSGAMNDVALPASA